MWTDLSEAGAREATVELERTRAAMRLWWGADFDPPGTVDVILLRRKEALLEFAPAGIEGFVSWAGDMGRPFVVMAHDAHSGQGIPDLVRHELAHYLSHFVLLRQPRWFAEGLAMYLEVSELRLDGTVALGVDNADALHSVMLRGALPLEALWAWDESEPSSHERFHFYASSWAWVHYLLNVHAERFGDFQRRLARAESPRQAWAAAFSGVPSEALERGLRDALKGNDRYTVVTRTLPPHPSQVVLRPLGDADVHLLRAMLYQRAMREELGPQQRLEAARREVEEALRREPGHARAAVFGAELEPEGPAKLARARELAAAHPEVAEVWALLGDVLSRDVSARAEREEVRRRAVRLAPDSPTLLAELALAYSSNGRHANALAQVVKAVRLAPWHPDVLAALVLVAAAQNRCEEATLARERAMDLLHESTPARRRAVFEARLTQALSRCTSSPL